MIETMNSVDDNPDHDVLRECIDGDGIILLKMNYMRETWISHGNQLMMGSSILVIQQILYGLQVMTGLAFEDEIYSIS